MIFKNTYWGFSPGIFHTPIFFLFLPFLSFPSFFLAFFFNNQSPLVKVSSCHPASCRCQGPRSGVWAELRSHGCWRMKCLEEAIYQLSPQHAEDGANGLSSLRKCQPRSTSPLSTASLETLIFLRAEAAWCAWGRLCLALFVTWQ